MSDIRSQYEQKKKEYDALIESADASKLPEIRKLNKEISELLSQMLENSARYNTADEEELVRRLQQIQKDYNGLITSTDDLETLRRIRAYETDTSRRTLFWYIGAMVIAGLLVVLFIFLFQRVKSIATTTPSPPATTSLV